MAGTQVNPHDLSRSRISRQRRPVVRDIGDVVFDDGHTPVAWQKQGRVLVIETASQFATCGADAAVGLNAAAPVRPEALLFLWRGYADPASRARPGPRFHAARGLLAETLTSLLFANLATLELVGR